MNAYFRYFPLMLYVVRVNNLINFFGKKCLSKLFTDYFVFVGILRVWNSASGKCVYTTDSVHAKNQTTPAVDSKTSSVEDEGLNITQLVYNKAQNSVTVVTYDQNISILGLEKLRLLKQVQV